MIEEAEANPGHVPLAVELITWRNQAIERLGHLPRIIHSSQ